MYAKELSHSISVQHGLVLSISGQWWRLLPISLPNESYQRDLWLLCLCVIMIFWSLFHALQIKLMFYLYENLFTTLCFLWLYSCYVYHMTSGRFTPLHNQTIFSIKKIVQHCTQVKFMQIFSPKIELTFGDIWTPLFFYFLRYKKGPAILKRNHNIFCFLLKKHIQ